MIEEEMEDHFEHEKSERSDNDNYRKDYKRKRINNSFAPMEIGVPLGRK